jgi:hypothetical protein
LTFLELQTKDFKSTRNLCKQQRTSTRFAKSYPSSLAALFSVQTNWEQGWNWRRSSSIHLPVPEKPFQTHRHKAAETETGQKA